MSYDPRAARYLCFAEERPSFAAGNNSPRAFLERCIEQIAALEPKVKAFVRLDLDAARTAADQSAKRWKAGQQLSAVDGLPVGIKDCFDVRGMPTECNSGLFAGSEPQAVDAAHVDALRRGGAIVVGKTVTTELTVARPGPTWNPWDLTRTPGGSSSGSAASVAARMLPLATGSQVRGSVLRPSSICGVIGYKPTFGALNHNGGVDPNPSLNHLGLLGGTLTDVWETAHHIAQFGPDPGYEPLVGGPKLAAARQPRRLLRQYTAGWDKTDAASQAKFEDFLRQLAGKGVEIVEPESNDELAAYEDATTRLPEWFFDILVYEMRWPFIALNDRKPGAVSDTVRGYLEAAAGMTIEDYRRALCGRADLRARHRALAGKVDGFITLCHIGPGQKGQPAVGTPWYNDASSAIGAPSFNLPLLAIEDVPLGVQLMGFEQGDAALAAHARWMLSAFGAQTVGPG